MNKEPHAKDYAIWRYEEDAERAFEVWLTDELRRDYVRWRTKYKELCSAISRVLSETAFTHELYASIRLVEREISRNVLEGLHWKEVRRQWATREWGAPVILNGSLAT
jgi:hypothetical protein